MIPHVFPTALCTNNINKNFHSQTNYFNFKTHLKLLAILNCFPQTEHEWTATLTGKDVEDRLAASSPSCLIMRDPSGTGVSSDTDLAETPGSTGPCEGLRCFPASTFSFCRIFVIFCELLICVDQMNCRSRMYQTVIVTPK
jgi:hypothetical protein